MKNINLIDNIQLFSLVLKNKYCNNMYAYIFILISVLYVCVGLSNNISPVRIWFIYVNQADESIQNDSVIHLCHLSKISTDAPVWLNISLY